ncbi:short-chain dehydrogenase/reductase SDR (plasmid) [Novosphingobium aromaticivorans DSM 12444]|uniref:Short-chain dehydrogenase/reductase SDR n=1 Tax=Novosphingobium aromaticivorans (strain ATCC 700278 / DSM 12444 / CCUG 56034 / CIP 105152 / NBRC 16084 / F199) TaxID=279238 RepID=A4XEY1_NOVAD|nr:SDR family oxidoreductase [Novosphingobium aromaticivorans]ABP64492.1 short-chain dehydrogenase/reductase SDR [Novosphingobium aromaticivorans DSM 12444]SCY92984.1 NAD(P)-dependent dehydrogenase, short-chain alcohol dehydrogenase family [Novosphingobium aromaticivorans]
MDKNFPAGATIVFGGSGGIGRGVSLEFAREGSDVAVVYRSKQDVAEAVAEEMRALGRRVSIHKADVRNRAEVQAAFAAAVAEHGRVHTVVWGAGPVVPQVPIAEWTEQMFRDSMEIEAFGFNNAVHTALPHMRDSGGGSFVHLGSAGHDWWPQLDGLSVAPKACNEALIKGIAKEEGRHEIRANSILVGVIDAGQFKIGQEAGTFTPEWEAAVKAMLPLKRWGSPRDIGQAAVFFASDRGNYVTGQTISVGGGFGV